MSSCFEISYLCRVKGCVFVPMNCSFSEGVRKGAQTVVKLSSSDRRSQDILREVEGKLDVKIV